MNRATAEWLVKQISNFDEGCEVSVRLSDGYILSYFYNKDKHTYHRGLRRIYIDRDHGLLVAESDYGLSGDSDIADFIDLDHISMISIIQNPNDDSPATL